METKEKKIEKEYKLIEHGLIPFNWEVKSIGEIFEILGGMPFPRSQTGAGDVLYLHYGEI